MGGMEQTVASGISAWFPSSWDSVWGHLREGQGLPIALSVFRVLHPTGVCFK